MLRDPDDVIDLANGFFAPRALLGAARAGVFEALAPGARTAAEVAGATATDARAMGLLLNALVALGLVERSESGTGTGSGTGSGTKYELSKLARECLAPGSPRDLRAYLRLDADTFECWNRFEESLRTGAPVRVSSRDARDDGTTGRERHRDFILGMRSTALGHAPKVAAALDFGRWLGRAPERLLDLGGGPGTYAVALCRRWPGLRATVFDLEETIAIAREAVRDDAPDVAARVDFRAGDFHADALGAGYDAVLVSHVIHGHPEATLAPLLERAAAALAPGGALVVHDFILDETRARPPFAALFALNMLVMSDRGRTYTFEEVRALLERAGLQGVVPVDAGERRGISLAVGFAPGSAASGAGATPSA